MTQNKNEDQTPEPIVLDICDKRGCRDTYAPLRAEIEQACDVPPGESIAGKVIDLKGKQVRVECTHCMLSCVFNKPRGTLSVGDPHKIAIVRSLPSLAQQIEERKAGTWKFEDHQ